MQMHESKTNVSTRGSSSASSNHKANNNNLPNNRVTSSANNDNNNNNHSNSDQSKKGKKKSIRDKQPASNDDAKPASAMSNLSSYSLIDDDHIDDQETINVGNLIIDLESDLEKEKIENEQANTVCTENSRTKSSQNATATNAPSSTSTSSSAKSNMNIKTTQANLNSDSKTSITKLGQKLNVKQLNNAPGTPNSNDSVATHNNGHTNARSIFKSSADERGELKMKITRETKPGKSEHKVSANQKSPTSSGMIGGLSKSNSNCENDFDSAQSSSISSTKECGTSTSVGTITEPDCLGPCEPGTSVTLEGIVWQETDGGILVVNVTWRGKTYVGALLDCTRHDWAPPRLCDSPASDTDLKTNKGVRAKRIVTRSNGNNTLDEKNLLQTTGKLRNGKGRRIPAANEPTPSCSKKQRDTSMDAAQVESNTSQINNSSINNSENSDTTVSADNANNQQDSISTSNILMDKVGPSSPMLIGCDEPNCSKRYRNMNGLLYHQAHAHGADNDTLSHQDDGCSSSTRDKVETNKTPKSEQAPDNQSMHRESAERSSPDVSPPDVQLPHPKNEQQQGLKRYRTPSPPQQNKMNKPSNPIQSGAESPPTQPSDSSNSTFMRRLETERRHSNTSNNGPSSIRLGDSGRRSPGAPPQGRSDNQQNSLSSNAAGHHAAPKLIPGVSKQNNPAPPPLPALTEEGMKPSGTSTGPPPAPHQGNCYFNPAFLANTFNPYALPPYFGRNIYDPMAPPTSNAAFLTRFMGNMRVPPPPSDSPSRLLSPSMPKNMPFSPFKVDPSIPPPPLPTTSLGGHPLPNISPHMQNPQHTSLPPPPPPTQVPPMPHIPPGPPPPLGSGSPNLRMPSQGDPLLPPTSQPPFLPPTSLSSFLGMHGMPNPLGPMGGPQMLNLVDDALAKQFPRRFS